MGNWFADSKSVKSPTVQHNNVRINVPVIYRRAFSNCHLSSKIFLQRKWLLSALLEDNLALCLENNYYDDQKIRTPKGLNDQNLIACYESLINMQ